MIQYLVLKFVSNLGISISNFRKSRVETRSHRGNSQKPVLIF